MDSDEIVPEQLLDAEEDLDEKYAELDSSPLGPLTAEKQISKSPPQFRANASIP